MATGTERMVTVHLPAPLREHAAARVAVEGDTVRDALEALARGFPGLRRHLFDDRGELRRYVNLYLNDQDVRGLPAGVATRIRPEDTITIVPSIAGGASERSVSRCRR